MHQEQVEDVSIGPLGLPGELRRHAQALGLVIFAHGSGSSRLSPRNRHVADVLHGHGLATLLFDLLTRDEAQDRRKVFDIPLLAERVTQAIDWASTDPELSTLPLGLFGASTGAAAALLTAAMRPARVAAVVSRGGRPDLAGEALARVATPTLLIVGGRDTEVLALNRAAQRRLGCWTELAVVPGATHLFEEQGALGAVAHLAGEWFAARLSAAPP